jgi:phage gpG-like protein
MISMRYKSEFHSQLIRDRAKKASFENLRHAGAAIRLTARRSIRRNKKASAAGQPPHTRKGQLKRSLRYVVEKDKDRVLIGPTYTVVGRSATAHEFGGKYKKQRYPKRPLMGPALSANKGKIPKMWADSVK